ncbi:MAG: hypothetical protein JWL59_3686 [Chthoniobacteraceae bacterium]|nr:hypothetical protein [Chthoniobacteraceae bacterium]
MAHTIFRAWQTTYCFLILLAILGGCVTPRHGSVAILTSPSERLCSRHRIPLITGQIFKMSPPLPLVYPNPGWRRWANYYPNHLTLFESLVRSDEFPLAVFRTYCPLCQTELETHLDP